MEKTYKLPLGREELVLSTGKLALQANGSVLARLGGTEVLATAVISETVREDLGYFPLMVDYEEKLYAAGKTKGSRFIKLEGRPTDEAILSARLVDRAIRPLFPKWIKNDVQVILTVLSFDKANDPDVVGLNAAAAALSISNIPWSGPIAGIRVAKVGEEWVVNPSYEERGKSLVNIMVAGTADKTIMLEADGREASEEAAFEAIERAHKEMAPFLELFQKMQSELGQPKLTEPVAEAAGAEDGANIDYKKETANFIAGHIEETLFGGNRDTKISRKHAVSELLIQLDEHLKELQVGKDKRKDALSLAKTLVEQAVVIAILEKDKRVDGRALDEIRPLVVEHGLLARTHGSGLFQRGETQILSVVTLDSPGSEQTLDTMEEDDTKKRYMHHYNFPPFSVGETGPLRGPGRREIGHGALAEKALASMLPSKEDFPYTIRVVSEVLGSNGSSSMGSVCGSTIALLDAGVPIRKNVAGIAMGLASDNSGRYKILTDLQDLEDGPGGMDFKVAGSRDGITAIQMDTKTSGLPLAIVKETLARARSARLQILDAIEAVIKEPKELSPFAPRITSLRIDPAKIRTVIGSGGKTINEIIAATGVAIDIEDDGLVMITSENPEGAKRAVEWIENLTHEVKVGEKFSGKVTRLMDFGAFVEVVPGQEGLVHISNLSSERVERVEDVVKIGDALAVEVTEIDSLGRINLKVQGVERSSRPNSESGPRRFNDDRHSRSNGRPQRPGGFRPRR